MDEVASDDSDEDAAADELPQMEGLLSKWTNYIHGWQACYIMVFFVFGFEGANEQETNQIWRTESLVCSKLLLIVLSAGPVAGAARRQAVILQVAGRACPVVSRLDRPAQRPGRAACHRRPSFRRLSQVSVDQKQKKKKEEEEEDEEK